MLAWEEGEIVKPSADCWPGRQVCFARLVLLRFGKSSSWRSVMIVGCVSGKKIATTLICRKVTWILSTD